MNKVIFTLNIENTIDLITNSSSELFVLKGKTKEVVIELLDETYPEWRNEYDEPKNISDLDVDELDTYFRYSCSSHCWPTDSKDEYPVLDGFTFDELYQEKNEDIPWNGQVQYELKNNISKPRDKWDYSFVTKNNKKKLIDKLSKTNGNLWFLYSIGENPSWENQENLMEIADRYHLG